MSFPRCLLQLVGERSQVPQCSLKPKRIRPVFQRLTEKMTFASSSPLSPATESLSTSGGMLPFERIGQRIWRIVIAGGAQIPIAEPCGEA